MPDAATFNDRLRRGLVRLDAANAGEPDERIRGELRRSLERTLGRLEAGGGSAAFRFQITGGKSLLFHGTDALPLEASRLARLLSGLDVELRMGEVLDLDGGLAAWVIRPEVTMIDTDLRHLEESLRGMKSIRDRDHAAYQTADSNKIRLRSKLTKLVGALQAAQRDEATSAGGASP